jgi:hypothetical protein
MLFVFASVHLAHVFRPTPRVMQRLAFWRVAGCRLPFVRALVTPLLMLIRLVSVECCSMDERLCSFCCSFPCCFGNQRALCPRGHAAFAGTVVPRTRPILMCDYRRDPIGVPCLPV